MMRSPSVPPLVVLTGSLVQPSSQRRRSRERLHPEAAGTLRALLLGVAIVVGLASTVEAQDLTISHHAGTLGGAGAVDGTASTARFHRPFGIAVDAAGTVYVADNASHTIRSITAGGVVTTLAGLALRAGVADGPGSSARFFWPSGVAVDASGTVVVADTSNSTIRKVTAGGVVTTLAGRAGLTGSSDGTGSAARFSGPSGVAVDSAGTLYVADSGNHTIRKVTAAGVVTTLAGLAGQSGSTDGTGTAARFDHPQGVAVDAAGMVYVADTSNSTIRKIAPDGSVTTLAGLASACEATDGPGSTARFCGPTGVAVDSGGTVYVADAGNDAIRQVTPTGVVTTVAGWLDPLADYCPTSVDGTGSAARFCLPSGVAVDASGTLYVTDHYNHTIRRVTVGGVVATFAGLAAFPGNADGTGSAARFRRPEGVAADAGGTVYVADTDNDTIRKVTADVVVTVLAGKPPIGDCSASADGTGSAARFCRPSGVAVDRTGTVFVADKGNNTIRRVTPEGGVTTLAGRAGLGGAVDGTGSAARFDSPTSVAVDAAGMVYVADRYNHTIRKVTPDGVVTTLAGRAGQSGSADGTGSAARFYYPTGVAVDAAGMVYVADRSNHTIRKVTPEGVVTTLAGRAGQSGAADGTGSAARFFEPTGVAVDAAGMVYVADETNCTIRQVTSDGVVTTLAGSPFDRGSMDGRGSGAWFNSPASVAVDAAGRVYVADTQNHAIRQGVRGGTVSDTDTDGLPDEWETRFGLNPGVATGADGPDGDPDNDGVSNAQEHAAGTHPRGFHSRYLAEGATSTFFDLRLALLNPGGMATTATLAFLPAGRAPITTAVAVPARTRVTVNPKTLAGLASAEFSTKVEADVPLVVDRTMTWDTTNAYGAHAETAVPAPAVTWYLAEGATHSGFTLFYLLQNPNATAAEVRVRYLRPSGAPLQKTYTLPATSRTNIWVDVEEFAGLGAALASTDVSAVVETTNGVPIIVERAMYFDVPGQTFGAGHESAGITAPATAWFLAEGATGGYFDLFVLIANPGTADAQVEATYLRPDGTTVLKRYTVAGNSRFNIWVDYEDAQLADTAVSTTTRALNEVPVIVERAMWWPQGGWVEAHNSPGAVTTGTRWAVAEGEVDAARNLETYLLIANTSSTPAEVQVTVVFEDGTSATRTFAGIAGQSRFNVPVGGFFTQAAGKRFGAIVESLGTTPAQIVVERAMYWDAAGQRWAAGTNALATRLQ